VQLVVAQLEVEPLVEVPLEVVLLVVGQQEVVPQVEEQ
jgi:hypothetical protein